MAGEALGARPRWKAAGHDVGRKVRPLTAVHNDWSATGTITAAAAETQGDEEG